MSDVRDEVGVVWVTATESLSTVAFAAFGALAAIETLVETAPR